MNRRGFLASTGSLTVGLTVGWLDGRHNGHSASKAQSRTTDTLTTRTAGDGIYRNPVFEHVFPDPGVIDVDGAFVAYSTHYTDS
jgi:hypothetical protein